MKKKIESGGSCLCGAVRLSVTADSNASACHCRMCRVWGGGPFISVNCGTTVDIEGSENVTIFNSSSWAERGFCRCCGTHLFYRLKAANHYAVPAALVDNDRHIELETQLFVDEKPAYYSFSNETANLTGAEVFEKYASILK